ncbi:MAG: hypothetical protein HRT89_11065 [Lentisphaeria bacterium]|nr:hypothetical protein [Lentisphaeria bacterium]NQZ68595.1 hypothetical protein [Lentisphaeria bacterium]
MKKLNCLILSCVLATLLNSCKTYEYEEPEVLQEEPAPVEVFYVRKKDAKKQYTVYYLDLKFWNPSEKYRWMVMRYFGDTKLSTDGAFGNKKPYPQPFKGKKFKGKGGSAIRIDFTGRKGDLFSAWYMPPKGVIHFREYRVMSEKAFDVFEIWQVDSIMVNAFHELRGWLPHEIKCDKSVSIPEETTFKDMDWDEDRVGSRMDYKKVKVEMCSTFVDHRWSVPIIALSREEAKKRKEARLKRMDY